jgi:hypothetical protein
MSVLPPEVTNKLRVFDRGPTPGRKSAIGVYPEMTSLFIILTNLSCEEPVHLAGDCCPLHSGLARAEQSRPLKS